MTNNELATSDLHASVAASKLHIARAEKRTASLQNAVLAAALALAEHDTAIREERQILADAEEQISYREHSEPEVLNLIEVTPKLQLLIDLGQDAPNWSGTPLWGSNVGCDQNEELLTALVGEEFVNTIREENPNLRRDILTYVEFTEKGKAMFFTLTGEEICLD